MNESVFNYFENNDYFKSLMNHEFDYLSRVYTSPEQIYGIAEYKSEDDMIMTWELAARELATDVQSQLTGILTLLKWDMYLILVVSDNKNKVEEYKKIENNRDYFRKIIITNETKELMDKLPLDILIETEAETEVVLFNDNDFFYELRSLLPDNIKGKLGESFFERNYSEKELEKMFLDLKIDDLGDK